MVGSFRELRDRLRSPAPTQAPSGEGERERHNALEANWGAWHTLLPALPPNENTECLAEWVRSLFAGFPLYWQRRHSRYLCQLSAWAKEREPALFLFTSTSFFRDAANPSLIIEEFQFELSHTVEAFDHSALAYLLHDALEVNITMCGPNRVIFGPLKIIAIEAQFQLLKALVEWCVREPSDSSNRLLKSLITLLQNNNLFFQFFSELLREQLSVAGELQLFRETNTPPAKLLQQYLLLHGSEYLSRCIVPLIRKTAKKQKEYEINPILLQDSKSVPDRVQDLEGLAGTFLEAIFASAIPPELTVLCASIKMNICQLDKGARSQEELNRLSLAAGFFLHFLCPACVSPSVAGLHIDIPTSAQRGLILCAKLFQMLANGNRFEVGYMTVMNPFLDRYQEPMRHFCTQVVEEGERHLPFLFNSSRPSSEFMDWWALFLFLVRHRDSLGSVLDEQDQRGERRGSQELIEEALSPLASPMRSPDSPLRADPAPPSEKLGRKLVVITDHIANLHDQYPYYWSRSGRFDQAHKEEWSEWETIWENEKQGKKTAPSELPVRIGAVPATVNPLYQQPVPTARPSRHRSVLTPVSSTSTIQARKSFSSGNDVPDPLVSPASLSSNTRQPFLMVPYANSLISNSPPTLSAAGERESLTSVLSLSPSEPSTSLKPRTRDSSSKRRKSRSDMEEESRSLNPFLGQAKRLTRGIASASSSALEVRRRASTGSADSLLSFAAPEQLSSSDLKKARKQFQAYLEDIRTISSPLPLYIDHDARIQSHLRMLFTQTKTPFHTKTDQRLKEWHHRFEHPLTLYCRKLYSPPPGSEAAPAAAVGSFYPAFVQSLIDLRDTLLLDVQGQYPLLAQLDELSSSCVVVVERFTFHPVYPFVKHFYRERYREENERLLKNAKAGKHEVLLRQSTMPLLSRNKEDYSSAVQELQQLSRYAAPTEKIFCIRKFLRQVFLVHLRLLESVTADLASLESYCFNLSSEELIPVILFAMGSAKVRYLYSEMQLLSDLAFPSTADREMLYYLALFRLCVQCLAGEELPATLHSALAQQVQLQADDHAPSPE